MWGMQALQEQKPARAPSLGAIHYKTIPLANPLSNSVLNSAASPAISAIKSKKPVNINSIC
jgi:hypothetical protein